MIVEASICDLAPVSTSKTVTTRRLLAFTASVGGTADALFDTRTPGGIVAHPLFAVSLEWPCLVDFGRSGVSAGVTSGTGAVLHVAHDLELFAPIKPGDYLTTTAQATGVVAIRPGVLVTICLITTNADAEVVAVTRQKTLYLGATLSGQERVPATPAALEVNDPVLCHSTVVELPLTEAHLYTEAAEIYNPIHTDRAIAEATGLGGFVLHGTATLGRALSAVVQESGPTNRTALRRVTGRFKEMVLLPATLHVHWSSPISTHDGNVVVYEVRLDNERLAIDRGALLFHHSNSK